MKSRMKDINSNLFQTTTHPGIKTSMFKITSHQREDQRTTCMDKNMDYQKHHGLLDR